MSKRPKSAKPKVMKVKKPKTIYADINRQLLTLLRLTKTTQEYKALSAARGLILSAREIRGGNLDKARRAFLIATASA